jgi:hypothetical protein
MNKQRFITFVLLVSLAIVSGPGAAYTSAAPPPAPALSKVEGPVLPVSSVADDPAIAPDFGKLPLSFVPNTGQTDPSVRFQVRSMGGRLFFTPSEVVLSLPTPAEPQASSFELRDESDRIRNSQPVARNAAVLHLHFEGANPTPEVIGAERLPGIVNYFIGNDPAKWRTNLPTYAGVVYRELYPGIDLHYGSTEGLLKGTYTVAPGADPSRIRWRYDGATSVRVDEGTGDLLIRLPGAAGAGSEGHTLTERAPVAWQSIKGQRVPVNVHYTIAGDGSIGFALGDHDAAHPLVLDPTLRFSTYLGGSDYDFGYDIAVDNVGNAYVTGRTWSTDFPTAQPLDFLLGGFQDAFVTKLNAAGDALLYSTYLGGSGSEDGTEIALDSSGSAYVVGTTTSTDFPTVNPLDDTLGGSRDGFVAKLNAAGNALSYSTYLGGSGEDYGGAIAVDSGGNAYVTGLTFSSDFPVADPLYGHSGGSDAFVTKLNRYGSGLFYSTYLGGSDSDEGYGIAADSAGNAYVTGSTTSTDFPATTLHGSPGGRPYAFVTKLSEYGQTLVYSIWLGGSGENRGDGIAVDSSGNACVTGITNATNFPTTVNPLQATNGGGTDAFVTKLNAAGDALLYSTYLGGSGTETQAGIAMDSEANVYVTGTTNSTDFPTKDPLDDTLDGDFDVFVAKLNAAGSALRYSTYLGGSGIEESKGGTVVIYAGTVYVTGSTTSTDFPTVNPLDDALGGGSDVFVSKITEGTPPVATIDSITPSPAVQGRDTVHFHGSGQDTDEGGAYITAYLWTSDIDGPLSTQEDFSIPASSLSVGTHTITLRVQDDEVEWSLEVSSSLTVQPSPADVRTLILVNRQKLAALYSASEADQVMNKLSALAAHDSVEGLVVQVENDAAVAAAYAAWDANPTNTDLANAVTAALKDVVDTQWSAYPNLEYLVIVGDDRVIPFRRVLDQTRYPESNYGDVSSTSTTGAALHADMTLTDDYYADAVPTVPSSSGWDGHDLYIPDLGTGRLIETPSEIIAQIDAFLVSDEVSTGDAIATGYDFFADGAQAMCSELTSDNLTTNCTLIGEHWGRNDFIAQVLNTRHDAVSINGHARHYKIGTPSGDVFSSDVAGATADHTRAMFYTVGCHSGLNVPPTNPIQPLDTAQALIQHRANYVANTGFGWGLTYSIGLSEQLMLDFTEHLVYGQSATVGQALAAAKQEYYLNDGYFGYYDEKIMIESTLYGLPMYRYTTPITMQTQNQEPAVIEEQQVTRLGNGLTVNSISYQFPPLTAESTDDGLYYTLGGLAQIDDSQPVQPKYTADLSFPTTEAHGVVFKGGVYTDVTSFNPVVAQAINECISPAEPSFDAPGWYPALLHNMNSLERGDTLVTLLGQFNASNQTERTYDRLSFDIYYHTTSDDWTEPTISYVQSTLNAGTATITVRANDPSGIHAVVVAYTDGDGAWSSAELTQNGGSWAGSFAASTETRFFVQAVDGAGNVAVDDNGGLYYQPGEGTMYEIFLPVILRNY